MSSAVITAVTAVAGVLLAIATAFGIAAASSSTPEPVAEPTVVYGER